MSEEWHVLLLAHLSEDSMYYCRLVGCSVMEGRPCIVMKWFGNGHLQVPIGESVVDQMLQAPLQAPLFYPRLCIVPDQPHFLAGPPPRPCGSISSLP